MPLTLSTTPNHNESVKDIRESRSLFEKSTGSPVKMCWQPAIWPPIMKYLLPMSHLTNLYSGRGWPLLPIAIASLPTTQKHFAWAAWAAQSEVPSVLIAWENGMRSSMD